MSSTTPNQGLVYPGPSDSADVSYWMQQLAQTTDTSITSFATLLTASQATSVTITTSAQSLATISLPAGTWRLSGEVQLDWAIAATGRLYSVRILNGTDAVVVRSALTTAQLTSAKTYVTLEIPVLTVTATKAIGLQVFMDATGGTSLAYAGQLTANRVKV